MDWDMVVCYCMNITNGQIKEAVDNGATTLEEVQAETGAGTVCGVCIDNVQQLVESLVKERDEKTNEK